MSKPVRTDEGGAPPVQTANPAAVENLADLASQAAGIDAPPPPEGAPAGAAVKVAAEVVEEAGAQDLADVLRLARDMSAPLVEAMGYLQPGQTAEIWSDAVLLSIAEPACELMRRHGLALADALDKLGPYVGLLVGLWGPSIATYAAIRANVAAAAQLKATKAGEGAPA